MKSNIHPKYFEDAQITCACGKKYQIGSTKEAITIEICAACHPFFTGTQKIIDSARRIEKFQARSAKASEKPKAPKKKDVRAAKTASKKRKENELGVKSKTIKN